MTSRIKCPDLWTAHRYPYVARVYQTDALGTGLAGPVRDILWWRNKESLSSLSAGQYIHGDISRDGRALEEIGVKEHPSHHDGASSSSNDETFVYLRPGIQRRCRSAEAA